MGDEEAHDGLVGLVLLLRRSMNKLIEIWHNFWFCRRQSKTIRSFWNGGDEAHEVCDRTGYHSEKGHVEQVSSGQFVWKVDVPAVDLSQSLEKFPNHP